MAVPDTNFPSPALRAQWTLPGAIANFFGLTLRMVMYEWQKMTEEDAANMRMWLENEGYKIVGIGGLSPMKLLANPVQQETKKDVDGPNYTTDDPLSMTPEVHTPGYTVGEEHPSVV